MPDNNQSHDPLINQTVEGYRFVKRIGEGTHGIVYLAVHPRIRDRLVAIKYIKLGDPRQVKKIELEIDILSRLQHPNVIDIYDAYRFDHYQLIVMELIRGGSLRDALRQLKGLLDLKTVIEIVEQLAFALGYVHDENILHLDLKPANILLDPIAQGKFARCVITDFGISQIINPNSFMSTDLVGTPRYMSPEHFGFGEYKPDKRSDIYSLGIILYELIVGNVPFQAEQLLDLLNQHAYSPAPVPSDLIPSIPAALDIIVLKSLAKSPDDRFQSASEMGSALRELRLSSIISTHATLSTNISGEALGVIAQANSDVMGTYNSEFEYHTSTNENLIYKVDDIDSTEINNVPYKPFFIDPSITNFIDFGNLIPKVQLVVMKSKNANLIGKVIRLKALPFRIGGDQEELTLEELKNYESQRIEITYRDKNFYIVDHSSSSTFINGTELKPHEPIPLLFNCSIRLSDFITFRFVREEIPDIPKLEGQIIDKRYMIIKLIKHSITGAVYQAKDRVERELAVKILSPDLALHPNYTNQFANEARIATNLSHEHLVSIYDYGVDGSLHYIVMPLLTGGTLSDKLEQGTVFSIKAIAELLKKLSSVLNYLHQRDVIHGNIKLTSVIFDDEERPFLTDLAIGSKANAKQDTIIVGAPAFIAPEQWSREKISASADQYALAVLTYKLVTGYFPFLGEDYDDYKALHLTTIPPLAHIMAFQNNRNELPESVSLVLNRALAKKPEDRFENVLTFAESFAKGLEAMPRKPKVFISYRRNQSSGWARLFEKHLKHAHGIEVFVDTLRQDGAVYFPKYLRDQIDECDVFVCLLGNTTLTSKWVRNEIQYAFAVDKPMIPVFQEEFNSPNENELIPEDGSKVLTESVRRLLDYNGLHLYTIKNDFVDETIDRLAVMILATKTK